MRTGSNPPTPDTRAALDSLAVLEGQAGHRFGVFEVEQWVGGVDVVAVDDDCAHVLTWRAGPNGQRTPGSSHSRRVLNSPNSASPSTVQYSWGEKALTVSGRYSFAVVAVEFLYGEWPYLVVPDPAEEVQIRGAVRQLEGRTFVFICRIPAGPRMRKACAWSRRRSCASTGALALVGVTYPARCHRTRSPGDFSRDFTADVKSRPVTPEIANDDTRSTGSQVGEYG